MANTLVPMSASLFEVNDPVPLTRLRVIADRPGAGTEETWYKGASKISPLAQAVLGYCEHFRTRRAG